MYRIVDHTGAFLRFETAAKARKGLVKAVDAMLADIPADFGTRQLQLLAKEWNGEPRNRSLARPVPGRAQLEIQIGACN